MRAAERAGIAKDCRPPAFAPLSGYTIQGRCRLGHNPAGAGDDPSARNPPSRSANFRRVTKIQTRTSPFARQVRITTELSDSRRHW